MRSLPVRISGLKPSLSLLVTVAAAVLLSACSSSVERFADNPSEGDSVYTASVPKVVRKSSGDVADAGVQDDRVTHRPLANAPIKSQGKNYASNGYNYQQTYKPVYKQPKYQAEQEQTASNEPVEQSAPRMAKSGTVRVGSGMTLYSIARANGLSVTQLARANNIHAPYSVHVGQVLRIPGNAVAVAPEPTFKPQGNNVEPTYGAPEQQVPGKRVHTVAAGETLFSLGRTYGMSPYKIADYNGLSHSTALRLGQRVRIPGGAGEMPVVAKAKIKSEDRVSEQQTAETNEVTSGQIAQPKEQASLDNDDLAVEKPKPQQSQQLVADQPAQEAGGLSFRWPVKGRVISGYGTKPGGLRNEGVNIAVPEGTGVRAAEAGVVAYAGNELKGYGNLVLIRHEGGWVTAYAHNKELFVKRGDAVKRGDMIAKAGQTGSVSSPQVHFEIRKGATAMDPMRFLNSSTASN
ncbi:MAG: peptidoglycan DD-metalloendopeptidase family protein [Parvibaculaceae bacterium]